ncbi:carboxylesterase [Companilactobacillus sp. RD055328]|uniref:alpha/beta hydrolase n=1 Tax=Companilactobacillus sp. RD055328 TaxID=2916634 RepID=UPI001FC85AAC|nr:alpha/beta fold hydrolase [Companilactobacillus sp. RD055328]GKQ43023.1 carboxylesterase [Companilactobacillus sp. RD055328]
MNRIKPETFYFNHGDNAVILLHSYTGTPNDMRLLARKLEDYEYSVYAPMFAGHGTSDPQNILTEGNPDIWWQQVLDAVDFLKKEGKTKIAIMGLSLGSIFATKALEELPEEFVCGGVFGSPLFNDSYENVRAGFMEYTQKVREHYHEDSSDMLLDEISKQSDISLQKIVDTTEVIASHLDKIKKPYFIGQGSTDVMVNPESAKKLKKVLEDTHTEVTFKWYEEAGHVITINKAHHQLEKDVIEFLNNNMK